MELPPRTRRILRSKLLARLSYGTTSAYAENTSKNRLKSGKTGNYLRVRGEYGHGRLVSAAHEELPPRTRRIQAFVRGGKAVLGTTSAYAENTQWGRITIRSAWNYLRVRGEYISYQIRLLIFMELPPRTRRILACPGVKPPSRGTTSAYAENTDRGKLGGSDHRNYLRVRGEYWSVTYPDGVSLELPPRTRRIPVNACCDDAWAGTTSAYAENTVVSRLICKQARNYLRVRGEYIESWTAKRWIVELPPRTRRIPDNYDIMIVSAGTTSAYAENTSRHQ